MATLLGIWTLGEHVTLGAVMAALVIFGGIYIVERAQ
jgi:drug/metabolite transporter (DMT)-like permease